ncbi:Pleckstrin y domain-containing family G member 5 [Nymphon striatum]|nr:Pleckstrin y domain-containing family G member 5 [Nymphon striatum]
MKNSLRNHILELEKKSNQDCFQIRWNIFENKPIESFQVIKGQNLRISNYADKINLADIIVSEEGSNIPVSLDQDTLQLSGVSLIVRSKEESEYGFHKTDGRGTPKLAPKSPTLKEERKDSFRRHHTNHKHKKVVMPDDTHPQQDLQQEGIKPAKHKTSGRLTSFFTNPFKNVVHYMLLRGAFTAVKGVKANAWVLKMLQNLPAGDKDKLEALIEQLRQYDQTGIPVLQRSSSPKNSSTSTGESTDDMAPVCDQNNGSSTTFNGRTLPSSSDNIYYLEKNWADILPIGVKAPPEVCSQQDVIWELVQTEVDYINLIKVITDPEDFCCFKIKKIMDRPKQALPEICPTYNPEDGAAEMIEIDKLFNKISEVYSANEEFWTTCILPMLADAREKRSIMNPGILCHGFMQFQIIFKPYTQYCFKQPSCLKYLKSKHSENEVFKGYLAVSNYN